MAFVSTALMTPNYYSLTRSCTKHFFFLALFTLQQTPTGSQRMHRLFWFFWLVVGREKQFINASATSHARICHTMYARQIDSKKVAKGESCISPLSDGTEGNCLLACLHDVIAAGVLTRTPCEAPIRPRAAQTHLSDTHDPPDPKRAEKSPCLPQGERREMMRGCLTRQTNATYFELRPGRQNFGRKQKHMVRQLTFDFHTCLLRALKAKLLMTELNQKVLQFNSMPEAVDNATQADLEQMRISLVHVFLASYVLTKRR